MECYGRQFENRRECANCNLKKWCREAADPPKLSHQMLNWDNLSELAKPLIQGGGQPMLPTEDTPVNTPLYSREDLLEVIGFLVALDTQTLEMLDSKIGNSGISFSEIARRRGVTRQAVHKFIKKKCAQVPELSIVLQNHSQKRKSTKSFMEEVCRIKKQMLGRKLKKQKANSKFSRKLICLNRNLDLSKMNIFKGSAIIRNALKA